MRTIRVVSGEYPDLVGLFGVQPIPTPFEYAVGAVSKPDGSKAVSHCFDPDPRYFASMPTSRPGWWDGSATVGYTLDQGSLLHVAGPGGRQVVQLDGTQAFRPPAGVSKWNADAATWIGAVRLNAGVTGNKYMVGPNTGGATGTSYVLIGNDRVSSNLGGINLPHMMSTAEQWLVIVATFSTERGSALRINGMQVEANPESTAPLNTSQDVSFWGGPGTSASVPGLVGHALLLDVDLSAPEYAADLTALEGQLCHMYDVG